MKKFIVFVIGVMMSVSAFAQFNSGYKSFSQAYPSAVVTIPNDGSVDYDSAIKHLQQRIENEKIVCILGSVVFATGAVMYGLGMDGIVGSATVSDYNKAMDKVDSGFDASMAGVYIMGVGSLAAIISGIMWSSDASHLRGLQWAKSGLGVTLNF